MSREREPVDVLLTDSPSAVASAADDKSLCGIVVIDSTSRSTPEVSPASLADCLDPSGRPQLRLPADASPREIALGCLLLAQIVQLKRSQHDADRREDHLRQLADTDPLTGLLNRRGFDERLLSRLGRSGHATTCCLAIFDIDQFKRVNDEHGHQAGDQLLRQVADRLSSSVRKGDLVCRYGGDEFLVALFGVAAEFAGKLVERLRSSLSEPFTAGRESVPGGLPSTAQISASAGWHLLSTSEVQSLPAGATPIGDQVAALYGQAFESADTYLREAKNGGRNRTIPS